MATEAMTQWVTSATSHALMSRTTWDAHGVNGQHWSFLLRSHQTALPILSISGVKSSCIRTTKMAKVEAVLLVSDSPVSAKRLSQLATLADVQEARQAIEQLNQAYKLDGCAFRIERVASGFRLLTDPAYAFWLGKLHQRTAELRLTPPAMETLSIVAYRQPITRVDIEKIRRVQCTDMLKHLMERGLVRIAGEDDSLGRPFLYETTRQFLELFGLSSLEALPMADTLRKQKPATAPSADLESAEPAASDAA